MRQHFTPYSQLDLRQFKELKALMKQRGMTKAQAADIVGIPIQRASYLLARTYPTPPEMRERRKVWIVKMMTDPVKARRTSPHTLATFFMIDEQFVRQMIRELRAEGRLPPATEKDEDEQEEILKVLRRHFPNVYRARTVAKEKQLGDVVQVAGKGWLTWKQCAELAKLYTCPKPSKC